MSCYQVTTKLEVGNNPPAEIGHFKKDPTRPSDTCPHTCIILKQNVNGLGKNDDKLKKMEKIIKTMIKQNIHSYCVHEMWQLGDYTNTICEHMVFHHGMSEKPNIKGRNSLGVMIILGHDLTQA